MGIEEVAFGMAVFLFAGAVKGIVGLGLPTIAIAILSLGQPIPEAMAMIALPAFATNIWQASVGGRFLVLSRRFLPLILPLVATLSLTVWFLGRKGPAWAMTVLAAVLIVYGAMGLARFRPRVPAGREALLTPMVGSASGFVAGVIGVPIVPLMPWLQALDLKPDELVQGLGIVLCATSLTLTLSLAAVGVLDLPRATLSLGVIAPAMAGMWIGQNIRRRLSVEQFRMAVYAALLLMGVYALYRSLA